jgi:hypothetical protein
MTDYLRVNGNLFSWGSSIVKIASVPYSGITGITFGDSRERAFGHGMGAHQAPRGRSRGKYTADNCKITAHVDTVNAILQAMTLLSGGFSYGNPSVPIIIQLVETDLVPSTTTLDRCCIVKVGGEYSEGPDVLVQDIEWSVMTIARNKQTLFDRSRGVP